MFDRCEYPFNYLCHGTKEETAKLIEKDKCFLGSEKPTNEFDGCFFTWWHVYPYSSFGLNATEFTNEIKEMKKRILEPFGENISQEEKNELETCLVTSGVFKLKLFPHFTHNFVYGIEELLSAYKVTMNCEELNFKKYGTFIYLKRDEPGKYYREIMYAIIICPANSKEFSALDDANDISDFLIFDLYRPEKVPWKWIPNSTSAGKETKERHWDHVAFAFYLKEGQSLCPKRKPTSIIALEGNLIDKLQNIHVTA